MRYATRTKESNNKKTATCASCHMSGTKTGDINVERVYKWHQRVLIIMETTVWTFNISVSFSEWVKIYDSEDVTNMHTKVGIKSLFRGVCKEDPTKVCAVQQAPKGVAQKVFDDNIEMIRGAGHIIESTVVTTYAEQ